MTVQAYAKGINIPLRKVEVVASLVRGRNVSDALTILEHTPRNSATSVKKVIESAKANAIYNHNYKEDGLYISEIFVSPGPSLKRSRSIAHGSFHRILKRTCHITVKLDGEQRPAKKVVKSTVSDTKIDKKETK